MNIYFCRFLFINDHRRTVTNKPIIQYNNSSKFLHSIYMNVFVILISKLYILDYPISLGIIVQGKTLAKN